MDAVLYVVAAVILLVLIVFAVKVRGRTEEGEGNIDIIQQLSNDASVISV